MAVTPLQDFPPLIDVNQDDVTATGTVTSVTAGVGLTGTPNPIVGAGTLDLTVPVAVANGGTGQITAPDAFKALAPLTTLGDLLYEDATPAPARLAGNTTATRKFLRQTGTGAISAPPAWDTLTVGDIPAGLVKADGSVPLTATWPAGNYNINSRNSVNVVNVKNAGAVGDLQTVADGAMTTGLTRLTSATGAFVPGDVGKIVTVRGAGAAGVDNVLVSTISSFTNPTIVDLANPAAHDVATAVVNWGTDDSVAIQNALNNLPPQGGTVYLPGGPYGYLVTSQIQIGTATAGNISTISGIRLVGDNVGPTTWNLHQSTGTTTGGTRICRASASATTILMVKGPIEGVVVEDLVLDANGLAPGGLDVHRAFSSTFRHIITANWGGGYAYQLRANAGAYVEGGGAPKQNVFEQVDCVSPLGTTATGFQLGTGAGNTNQNTFIRCLWLTSNNINSPALDIHNSDHNAFYSCLGARADGNAVGIGLQFSTSGGVQPISNMFYSCSWLGGINQNGAAISPAIMSYHFPWDADDSEPTPPVGANGTTLARNVAVGTVLNIVETEAVFFGPWRFQNQVAFTNTVVNLVNGLNSNIAITDDTMLEVAGPSAGFSIGGFVVTTPRSRLLHFFNAVGQQMTIVNESGASAAANRITTLTGADVVLRAGNSFATFIYNTVTSRWILTSYN